MSHGLGDGAMAQQACVVLSVVDASSWRRSRPTATGRAIVDLQTAINAYLAEHNASPKPFVWTQSADAILAKLERCPVPSV